MPEEPSIPVAAPLHATLAPIGRSVHRTEPRAKHALLVVREVARLVGKRFEPAVTIRSMLHLVSELLGLNRGQVVLRNGMKNEIAIGDLHVLQIVASLIGQILNINRLASEKTAHLESENFELKSALARSVSSYGIVGGSAVPHAALRQVLEISLPERLP